MLNKFVKLENIQSEKYGRILADVYIGDIHLNDLLCLGLLARWAATGKLAAHVVPSF